ncbi:MAG: SCO family protein [Candidatus Hydrogenedentes bacterium]|nr:SCO family protein [Candidatus Hydrogenedentota bacterium]
MKSRRIGLVVVLSAILIALSVAPWVFRFPAPQPVIPVAAAALEPLPDLGPVPNFELVAENGEKWSSTSLEGKVWVADFFLTSCQGACPVMMRHMWGVHEYFKTNDCVQFVSISVDPDTDKPEVIANYAKEYKADTARWKFLTGPIEEVHRMASEEGFKVGVPETPMQHSRRFILVDARGRIRGYYEGMDEMSVRECIADIERLLEEQA